MYTCTRELNQLSSLLKYNLECLRGGHFNYIDTYLIKLTDGVIK